MNEKLLERIHLNDYQPEEFIELYVCALMIIAEDNSIRNAHDEVQSLREQLDFELLIAPPQKEMH
jgi:isopentenyldiphosphate isomerase